MASKPLTDAERYQADVFVRLERLTDELIRVLRRLVAYRYPPEVVCVDFEVFCDGFTDGFPVRAFFMDEANCEYFVYRGDRAEYPCDVDPGLLQIEHVFPTEFNEPYTDLDTFTLAGEALIPWFARCWVAAGGERFDRRAEIGLHDSHGRFDLVRQTWVDHGQ